MTCNIATPANAAVSALLLGENLDLPTIDLNSFTIPEFTPLPTALPEPNEVTLDQLTDGKVNGTGVFDRLMTAADAHLAEQYKKNRMTSDAYAQAYVEMIQGSMQAAVQFLLTKDQSYWTAVTAKQQAYLANANLAKATVEAQTSVAQLAMVIAQMKNERATFALTKAKVASEEVAYCAAAFNVDTLLPKQADQLDAQLVVIQEQGEQARAQTLDTRSDGTTPVAGSIGKQKALQTQQIESYLRDQEYKYLKILTDAWVTQKTMDEALVAPTSFTNMSIDAVMAKYRTNTNLV